MHVAIDGPSGAGKSTVARRLARELGCDMGEITKFGGGSWLTCGRIKE